MTTLRVQNDSTPESAWAYMASQVGATDEESSVVDQCEFCRAAPGMPHAIGCDIFEEWLTYHPDPTRLSSMHVDSPNRLSTERDDNPCEPDCPVSQTGHALDTGNGAECDCTAQAWDSVSNAVQSHATVESCPECGVVTDIDYGDDEVRCPDEWIEEGNPLHAHMRATFDACLEISVAKNAGYAGDADPLANFKTAESLGIPVPLGIAVRMSDKWARLTRLLKTGENPLPSESITDTLQDLINYAAILLYAMETET